MQHLFFLGQMILVFMLVVGAIRESKASPPPPKQENRVVDTRPVFNVAIKQQIKTRWDLRKNFAYGMRLKSKDGKQAFQVVRAVNVANLDQTQRRDALDIPAEESKRKPPFAVWSKHFANPDLRFSNGYASVVDENVFTDLRMVSAKGADKLNLDGIVIGRVKLTEYDPVQLVQFLVASGIVDANIHIEASVSGSYFSSEQGDWFSLHSDDPYWTNRRNHASYDFGIHIETDGTVRLINDKYVGRLLAKDAEQPDAANP